MPIFNEFLVLILIGGAFCILGVIPVIMQVRTKNKPQRWNYKVESTTITKQEISTVPIVDLANTTKSVVNATTQSVSELELSDYTHMVVNAQNRRKDIDMVTSELEEDTITRIFELCDNVDEKSSLDVIFDRIVSICEGEKTASLVTNTIPDLKEDEMSVIFGKFLSSEFALEWDGMTIPLSYSEPIYQENEGYLLLKGMKLITGEFRVISWDVPENVEAGYEVEQFEIYDSNVG